MSGKYTYQDLNNGVIFTPLEVSSWGYNTVENDNSLWIKLNNTSSIQLKIGKIEKISKGRKVKPYKIYE